VAVGGIFAVDLFVYSQAAVLNGFVPLSWEGRGIVNTCLLPLFLLGVKRRSEWQSELFVSREVVFYTASLIGVGGYLLSMGLVAYVIRTVGGAWSVLLELAFLLGALAVLLVILFSTKIRARLKVFLVKHFYRNKYDYRQEWLHLTQMLGRTADLAVMATNALAGLARILESSRAELWLEKEAGRYERFASLGSDNTSLESRETVQSIVAFLQFTGWVIDTDEYARAPDRYGTSFGHPSAQVLPAGSVIVPLDRQGHLQGFVILHKAARTLSLNFEDHDILKTAGRQVAVVLAQAIAQEKLAETRQFEVMSRLSAFLMHDLKNVVAQQELVLANAQRFRHRPEFIDDAFVTIRSGVERIKRVLEQLGSASRLERSSTRVDVSKVLMEVRSHCADREPVPEVVSEGTAAWVQIDRDELTNVLLHLVRNAQDATPANGNITLSLAVEGAQVIIVVADTGSGMDPTFVRDRLFRPFDSTKGAKGMGIGAYQARHVIRAARGELEVASEPGVGTSFRLRLPSAPGPQGNHSAVREVLDEQRQ
jgi:putative PEP-CTERM system histidine kinase